ncbi:hypothetical protein HPP92_003699 [Vanilla planifolia]|uniref:Uncharacterized protein n=1 Tax=Vanilla planifolia TaxID=51239 RepID=A0A835SGY3_VANPL|nr:hypothetical protein HPP92_003699 [Vanilla planifolia]
MTAQSFPINKVEEWENLTSKATESTFSSASSSHRYFFINIQLFNSLLDPRGMN